MADELYVKVGSTIEPVALEADTAPEFVERIEGVEAAVPALDKTLRAFIAQEVAKCLKLSGGSMTGTIRADGVAVSGKDEYSSVEFWGGDPEHEGATLKLFAPNNSGEMWLTARDEQGNANYLILEPDGKATVSGSRIVTSTGETMDGKLTFKIEQAVTKGDDTSILRVIGATSYANGGNLVLYGKGHNNKGAVELQARDGSNTGVFRVLANGSATLASKPVIALTASWADGAGNWYRKYSDGWIEQGGRYSSLVARGQSTITLHTAFTSSNYTVSLTGTNCLGSHHLYDTNSLGVVSQTSTSMTIEQYNNDTDSYWGTAIWYACGY